MSSVDGLAQQIAMASFEMHTCHVNSDRFGLVFLGCTAVGSNIDPVGLFGLFGLQDVVVRFSIDRIDGLVGLFGL